MHRFVLIVVAGCAGHVHETTSVDGALADDAGSSTDALLGDACATCGSGSGRIVLFGGTNNGALGDTWSFDGTTWTALAATGPTPGEAAMATLGDRVVAFDTAGETWLFDGTAWTQVPGAGPSARSGPALATLGSDVVLFGGTTDGNNALGDTWIFDGTTWTQSTATGPAARSSGAMAMLGTAVVLHGGRASGGTSLGDTWSFDGTTWTKLVTGEDAFFPSMAALGTELVMYRGPSNAADPQTTWTFDGTAWKQVGGDALGGRYLESMATLADQVVLFGGIQGGSTKLGDTWTFDGAKWTQIKIAGPSARAGQGMAWLP